MVEIWTEACGMWESPDNWNTTQQLVENLRNVAWEILWIAEQLSSNALIPLIRQMNQLSHKDAIRMWLWELPFAPAPEIMDILRNLEWKDLRYWPNAWLVELRKAIANEFWDNFDENNVTVTIWVQQAVYLACEVLKQCWAKKILVPSTYFWIYKSIPTKIWLEIWLFDFWVDSRPDMDSLRYSIETFSPDIVILNSPCNPTWIVFSEQECIDISKILSESWNPFVVSDEIYRKLTFWEIEPKSFFTYYWNTIVVDWISKSWAAAWARVWWLFTSDKNISTLISKASTTMISSPPKLNQLMALQVVSWNTESTIELYRKKLKDNYQIVVEYLEKFNRQKKERLWFEDCVKYTKSEWWFYCFIDISYIAWPDSEQFCKWSAQRENWVVVIPWKAFWKPTCVRLSFAVENIEEWMKAFIRCLNSYSVRVWF